MKTFLWIIALLWLPIAELSACSYVPESFCETSALHPTNLVVTGQIVAIDEDGIDLQVYSVLRGNEGRETIRIWDGTDFDCNGIFSMASADLGNIGDSLVLVLPQIDTIQNTWDVIGDYRRPDYFGYTPVLKVINNKVRGFIYGGLPANSDLQIDYDYFSQAWTTQTDCSGLTSSSKDENKQDFVVNFNNPISTFMHISFEQDAKDRKVEIISIEGSRLLLFDLSVGRNDLDLTGLDSGMYFMRVFEEGKFRQGSKFIKH